MAPNGKLIIEIPIGHPPPPPQVEKKESEVKESEKKKQVAEAQTKQQQQHPEEAQKREAREAKEAEKQVEKKEERQIDVTTTKCEEILPQIIDGKHVEMCIQLPEPVDVSKLKVSVIAFHLYFPYQL